MNKQLLARRFSRAAATYDQAAQAQRQIAAHLWQLTLPHLTQAPTTLLEIGCGTGMLTRIYAPHVTPTRWILNDIYDSRTYLPEGDYTYLQGDAEQLDFGSGFDLILSASAIQWFSDLPAFLRKVFDALKPGGLLAISTFGPTNYDQLRQLGHTGLSYPTTSQLAQMLPPFELLTLEEQLAPQLFETPWELLRHIKATGVAGGMEQAWSRSQLNRFVEAYHRFQTPEGLHPLTYHPIWFVARKPF